MVKQFDVFFKDKRISSKSFNAHSVKDVIISLRFKGISKSKIKQIQSEGRIIKF